jgi:hypothetical protein
METQVLAQPITNVLDAIQPFSADDGHKGTFILLRIAGMEQGTALKVVNRKFRSWQNWRATYPDFKRLDEQIPALNAKFGGEARVVRTAMLDTAIIEAGLGIFTKILTGRPISDGMWAYATKLAAMRVPVMGAAKEAGNAWERLANSIKSTMSQRELIVTDTGEERSIVAREVVIQPSPEQRKLAADIISQALSGSS